jgi:hypothetical protein
MEVGFSRYIAQVDAIKSDRILVLISVIMVGNPIASLL